MDKEQLIARLDSQYRDQAGYRADLVRRGVENVATHFQGTESAARTMGEDLSPTSRREAESEIDHIWETSRVDFEVSERQRAQLLGPLSWWAAIQLAYKMWQWGRFLYLIIREAYERLHPTIADDDDDSNGPSRREIRRRRHNGE